MPKARGHFIDGIKINQISVCAVDGERFWRKERKQFAAPLVTVANIFFKMARNPVRLWTSLAEWQRWEIDSFVMLNGPTGFRAYADGPRAVCASELPGRSLSDHLDAGTISERMFIAAGRELSRVHACSVPPFRDGWSHADPHLGNVIYDAAENRARLIDFEVAHLSSLSAIERHADDLLIFLQDLVGLVSIEKWQAFSRCFIDSYGDAAVSAALRQRLVVPRWGPPRVWWTIRTNYLPHPELVRRMDILRKSL